MDIQTEVLMGLINGKDDYEDIPQQFDEPTTRKIALDQAAQCVLTDRNNQYGEPEDNFGRIAALWSEHFQSEITCTDVAVCMALVKMARIMNDPTKLDSWVDLIGYAACGAEVSNAG